jgi:PilZ domain-containing protein
MPRIERHYPRLPVESRVFIEMEAAAAGSSEGAAIVVCKTLDVSSEGLRVAVPQALTVGAFLQIGVDHPGEPEIDTFYLAGEVRWCTPGDCEDYPWIAGFFLLPAEHSDINRWEELINDMDSEP